MKRALSAESPSASRMRPMALLKRVGQTRRTYLHPRDALRRSSRATKFGECCRRKVRTLKRLLLQLDLQAFLRISPARRSTSKTPNR